MKHSYKGYDGKQQGYAGKESKNLDLFPLFACPAAHLQMVVEGSHAKHSLAVGQLEVTLITCLVMH